MFLEDCWLTVANPPLSSCEHYKSSSLPGPFPYPQVCFDCPGFPEEAEWGVTVSEWKYFSQTSLSPVKWPEIRHCHLHLHCYQKCVIPKTCQHAYFKKQLQEHRPGKLEIRERRSHKKTEELWTHSFFEKSKIVFCSLANCGFHFTLKSMISVINLLARPCF